MSADPAATPSGVVTFLFTDIEGSTRFDPSVGGRCQVAKATYRDILERRARENAVDFVEGVATALTPIAFFETFMVKSYETRVDSDTRVDVNTGIVAASRLRAVIGSRDYSIDIAEMVARIPRRRARCA
ncbi:MAG: hypothetical protein ABWY20_08780 [Mycobacterium sp.]